MKLLDFYSKYDAPIALALGFFDCIHLGHRALINAAKCRAEDLGIESAALTFSNDIGAYFGAEKQIYTFEERASVLDELEIDNVIAAKFDSKFKEMSAEEYFNLLTGNFNVKCIFAGADHTFGKDRKGNIDLLRDMCSKAGIELHVVPFESIDGEKISTSHLKTLVKAGDIGALNALLGAPYIISGKIEEGRHVGRSFGFPTANIPVREDKLTLKSGIYATTLTVDGTTYGAMTNIGDKPTFGDSVPTIETYIFDFDGDLYGKDVKIKVYERTRDIKKFDSPEALKAQLESDEAEIKSLFKTLAL